MNVKKLFPEKRPSKKSILEFIEKRGFYIALILCVAIVGASAVLLSINKITLKSADLDPKIIPDTTMADSNPVVDKNKTAQSSVNSIDNSKDKKVSPIIPTVPTQGVVKNGTEKQTEKNNTKSGSTNVPAKSVKAKVKVEKFIKPVFGAITFDFSMDKLVYSKTLDEWRTHSGVDFAADRGTPVKAVADGVVFEIKNDPRYGIMVLIDHQNGIKTVYANLASDDIVMPNQIVKQGEVIGSVGNTATFESIEQSHVHFEVLKDNLPVNPANYLLAK